MEPDWQEAEEEEALARLYEDHKVRAIEEFTEDRLKSYYVENPDIVEGPAWLLNEATTVFLKHPSAAYVLAASSMEIAVRDVMLKPVVYGLVHQESLASLITSIALRQSGLGSYRELLFGLLSEYGGIDMRTLIRPDADIRLWQEIRDIGDHRNQIVHRAERSTREEAGHSIAVAKYVFQDLIHDLLAKLGLRVHAGPRVCIDPLCRVRHDGLKTCIAS